MTWLQWKRVNADKIAHPVGYEEAFVDKVLSRIPNLNPSDVIPQFSFLDNNGRQRRVDFMIKNEEKGICLPIELDGRRKDQTGELWNDFLERQNALVRSFGMVLRYSNAKMFNNPEAIIRELSDQISIQVATKIADDRKKSVLDNFLSDTKILGVQTVPIASSAPPAKLTQGTPGSSLDKHTQKRLLGAVTKPDAPQPKQTSVTSISLWISALGIAVAIFVALLDSYPRSPKFSASQQNLVRPGLLGSTADAAGSTNRSDATTLRSGYIPEEYIEAIEAWRFVGNNEVVCDFVTDLRETGNGIFISFGGIYPNQTFSAVIWRRNGLMIDRSQFTRGQRICIEGPITTYRDRPQIEVSNASQIYLGKTEPQHRVH